MLAAGGIGTPVIMQNAGFFEAGNGMAMDTTTIVYGTSRYGGISSEPPMSVAYTDDENGYMLSTLIDPWLLYPMINSLKGIKYPFTWFNYGKTMGMMIKIKDELSGGVTLEGRVSKPLTPRDRYRLNHASIVARKILVRAGCDPDSIFVGPLRGTHPCATVRIGEMLDQNLRTEVENLYAATPAAFPSRSTDRPCSPSSAWPRDSASTCCRTCSTARSTNTGPLVPRSPPDDRCAEANSVSGSSCRRPSSVPLVRRADRCRRLVGPA